MPQSEEPEPDIGKDEKEEEKLDRSEPLEIQSCMVPCFFVLLTSGGLCDGASKKPKEQDRFPQACPGVECVETKKPFYSRGAGFPGKGSLKLKQFVDRDCQANQISGVYMTAEESEKTVELYTSWVNDNVSEEAL